MARSLGKHFYVRTTLTLFPYLKLEKKDSYLFVFSMHASIDIKNDSEHLLQ